MKADLSKRLETLERRYSPEEMTILVQFVSAGAVESNPFAIASEGWRIDREEGEPLEAFRGRALANAPENSHGVRMLMELEVDRSKEREALRTKLQKEGGA